VAPKKAASASRSCKERCEATGKAECRGNGEGRTALATKADGPSTPEGEDSLAPTAEEADCASELAVAAVMVEAVATVTASDTSSGTDTVRGEASAGGPAVAEVAVGRSDAPTPGIAAAGGPRHTGVAWAVAALGGETVAVCSVSVLLPSAPSETGGPARGSSRAVKQAGSGGSDCGGSWAGVVVGFGGSEAVAAASEVPTGVGRGCRGSWTTESVSAVNTDVVAGSGARERETRGVVEIGPEAAAEAAVAADGEIDGVHAAADLQIAPAALA